MPVVPRTEGPSIAQAGVPGVRQTVRADTRGADAIAAGLQQAGNVVGKIAANEQAKADELALFEARNKLDAWEREQFSDENPDGFKARKGKDALGLADEAATRYDARRAEVEAELRTPRQRAAFQRLSQEFGGQLLKRVDQYAGGEYARYTEATEQATMLSMSERAALAAREGRLDDMASEVSLAHAAIDLQVQRQGLGPEVAELRRAEFTSNSLIAATNGMLEQGDFEGAVKFYRANSDDLLESDRARMDNTVRNAELEVREKGEANAIMAKLGTGSAAVRAAEEIADPMLRDRVVRRIDQEAARRERAQNEADRAARRTAYDAVYAADPGAPVDQVVPPEVLLRMEPQERMALEGFQERRLANTQTRTDPRVFESLSTMPPEELAKVNLDRYYVDGKLSLAHYEGLRKEQEAILNPDPSKVPRSATKAEILSQNFRHLGISPTGKRDEAKRGQFRTEFYDAERAAVKEKGRELTQDEQEALASQLSLRLARTKPGWLWDTTEEKRLFEIPAGERGAFTVPADVRERILADAKAEGYDNLTDEQVRQAYARNAEFYNRLGRDE